jgi:DoxX
MNEKLTFLAARAAISALFLWSGVGKLVALGGTAEYVASAGVPLPWIAVWGAVIVELGFGTALLVGYRTALERLGAGRIQPRRGDRLPQPVRRCERADPLHEEPGARWRTRPPGADRESRDGHAPRTGGSAVHA